MTLARLLEGWPAMAANITARRTFPARPAQTSPLPADLHPALAQALADRGLNSLYTHQAAAWEHVQAGRNPVIVTGTASGKTLAYNLPVLHHLLQDPSARALYLFPTKALAYDQAQNLADYPLPTATYDGDTPQAARPAIRQQARLLISNPDMLHTGILPHHTRWADFFGHLRFLVIDEMHVYRGVFGSHVANMLRRLKRVARFYGAAPRFILTSATIANPLELAGRLVEEPVTLVDNDGAARGARHFIIYNPPIINPDLGLRRGLLPETVRLAQELSRHNLQTIIFGRTRRTVELLLATLRQQAPGQVRGYRSGYLPARRREIEQALRQGQVQTVVATTALELGIDIGSLGAALLAGYPGTIAGTWQQAGRAGRQLEESLALLITSASPLDQFLANHPDYFFGRSPEQALINPDNPLILWQHLRCAAFELPFRAGDGFGRLPPGQVAEFLHLLQQSGHLHQSGQKYFWMADHYPAGDVSLRTASPAKVLLQTETAPAEWTTIGEVDRASAPWMVHPQAIYLHEGQTYLVEKLDLEHNVAHLRPAATGYYTEPRRESTIRLLEKRAEAAVPGATKGHGELSVSTQVIGYNQVDWHTHQRLGQGQLSLPPEELQTSGYWLALDPNTVEHLRAGGLWGSDPIDYGPNWASQRRQVRARDGYQCQLCGAPEQGQAHHVHHKIPFRTFASYRQANQPANLVTLCPACHRRAEMAVRIRSGLAGLAFVLGHLAPLFLMCDSHDIAVHTDPHQPAVTIYELAPGGIGFSERLFTLHADLVARARELVVTCPCNGGCPSCVGPAGEAGQGGKKESLAILELITKT